MSDILISIIIPAYNCDKYIGKCLDSVLSQKVQNFEVIIVNDGSNDSTKDVCEEYSKKDKRIKLFNNENHGVSYSRNFGIQKSLGKYLCFIDSDDIISSEFLSKHIKNFNDDIELSIVGIKSFKKENEIKLKNSDLIIEFDNIELIKEKLFFELGGYLANKMYISSIIKNNNLKLNENISISEDLLFNLEYISYCKKIIYNSSELYFYRIYSNSSFYNLKNKKWFSILDTYSLLIKNKKMIIGIEEIVLFNYFMLILEAKYRLKFFNQNEELKNDIKQRFNIIKDKYKLLKISHKIKITIFYLFPAIVMYYKRRKVSD